MKRIVILGGGTAGWVTASILAKNASQNGFEVTIIDTADIPTIGVGEASIPTIYDLLRHVGIEDHEVVSQAGATFKYGIQFEGWSKPGEQYMHGFGTMGPNFGDAEFITAWIGAARYFTSRDLGPFTPTVSAARKGRFSRGTERPADAADHLYYPLCELCYALHFDASLLARLLRSKALEFGATHLRKHITDVEKNDSGIVALLTEDGERIEGDLFIDCSGLYGFLARKTLNGEFEDWREFLPCDGAIAVQTERSSVPNLYTRSIAHKAGWRWEIQLQGRTGNGSVFCSDYMSDDEATDLLLKEIEGEPITEPRKIAFQTGMMPRPWNKNCVAIGLSAGFLEPLESTSIHLICGYALRLEELLSEGRNDQSARDEFNAAWSGETREVRNFLLAHYVINQRSEPFWKARREGPRPEKLEAYLAEFERDGWITMADDVLFGTESFFQILIGQQFPLDYNRFAVPREHAPQVLSFLQNVAAVVDRETTQIPRTHAAIIDELRAKADA